MTRVRHIKKGDTVVCLSGAQAGKTGKVLEVRQAKGLVKVDGLGLVKRHTKPTQQNPKGGIVEQNRWFPASKFMASEASGKKLGRVGFQKAGEEKKRIYSSARVSKK